MSWAEKAQDFLDKKKKKNYSLDEGPNEIRVLPTKASKKDKEPSVHKVYRAHQNVGPEKRFVICGKNEDGSGDCWLDDKQIPKLEKSDSKAKRKQAEAMKPKEIMAMQIAYIKKKKWKGPELMRMNSGGKKSIAFRLLKTISNPKYNAIHLTKGRNVEIDRDGTGLDTEYSTPVLQSEKTEVPEKIVKAMKTFDELIPKYDERRMKAAYFGKDLDESSSSSSNSNSSESEGDDSEMKEDKKKKKASDEDSEEASSSSVSSSASDSEDSEKESSEAKSSSEASSSEDSSSEEDSEAGSSDSEEKSSDEEDSESKSSEEDSETEDSEEEKPKGKGKGKGKPGPKGKAKGKKKK